MFYRFMTIIIFIILSLPVLALLAIIMFFVTSLSWRFAQGQFNSKELGYWVRGKTSNPLSPDNKAGMIIRSDGSIDFQSAPK